MKVGGCLATQVRYAERAQALLAAERVAQSHEQLRVCAGRQELPVSRDGSLEAEVERDQDDLALIVARATLLAGSRTPWRC